LEGSEGHGDNGCFGSIEHKGSITSWVFIIPHDARDDYLDGGRHAGGTELLSHEEVGVWLAFEARAVEVGPVPGGDAFAGAAGLHEVDVGGRGDRGIGGGGGGGGGGRGHGLRLLFEVVGVVGECSFFWLLLGQGGR